MTAAVVERKAEDFKSEVKVTWCPGCGDFGVLNATYKALAEQGYDTKDVVVVSGIGCSSRFPFFVSTYGFHGVHGRALPIATGIKMSRPELEVVVFGGDGDAFAIGAGHFVHACRRNIDMCYVIMDNAVYGLTKGQYSPTSHVGFVSKTTPTGSSEEGINPLMLAIASGATYVARGFSSKPKDLTKLIVDGINHKGFAVIDCYSPCPTFNKVNTFNYWKDETTPLPAEHDPRDRTAAITMALTDDPLYLGLFYQKEGDSFGDRVGARSTGDAAQTQALVEKLIAKYS
ncbi:MAG: 2-oxoglutarate/2-oxoacid ferredoxin oxidoreductase, beta subunit [uncultured Thermomicrobiales bacterium]|uniref:2-oxoglutarate/2-oxoacid ferredoxin oxidoreductase, beta subunit n=1 Tax=uncultured Thermomicrobiales bacterium TaxID=1645740 RepID=A0A6J4V181_9BACT|nr:MAG: 2-oxoglutarate/2-oxoacid ferredoxin oxidoreductase, beta subunit [uncultured Thermomicrobiales bacterium]